MTANLEAVDPKSVPQDLAALNAQVILDSSPAAAIVVDPDGTVVGLNALAEELIGDVVSDTVGRKAGGAFGVFLERARRAGGMHASFEHYFSHAWYAIVAFHIQSPDKPDGLQAVVAADITEVKTRNLRSVKVKAAWKRRRVSPNWAPISCFGIPGRRNGRLTCTFFTA